MIIINETKQDYFDKTVEHMARQKHRAIIGDVCMYRVGGNLKCNFGIFIPDEKYSPIYEGKSVKRLVDKGFVKFEGEVDILFANRLQEIHDFKYSDTRFVKSELRKLAIENTLDYTKVDLIIEWNGAKK